MKISIKNQVLVLTNSYSRHGGKRNRKQQITRMVRCAEWICEKNNITHLEQIGKSQVRDFFYNNNHLKKSTLTGYFYAMCVIWELLERNGELPRP